MTPRTASSAARAPSPPYSQLDEVDAHLPDDVTEQVAKLAYLLQAELVEWQAPRSLVAQAVAKAATRGWRLADNDQLIGDPAVARLARALLDDESWHAPASAPASRPAPRQELRELAVLTDALERARAEKAELRAELERTRSPSSKGAARRVAAARDLARDTEARAR